MLASTTYDGYRDLFVRHPQPMWVFEVASLRFLDVNDAACDVYGYTRDQFLEMTANEIRPVQDRRSYFEFVHASENDSYASTLWRHVKADGSTFYVDVISQPIDFHGTPARIVIASDATARLGISRALSESRSALAEAQELAHLGSFDFDVERGEMRWSAELFRILGVDPARERPGMLYEFDHVDDRAAVVAAIERARSERTSYAIDHRIVRRDGGERYVHESGRFFYRDGFGAPTRAVGAILDITERKDAEERLRHLAERDALTGLPNRTVISDRLVCAIDRARARGSIAAVFFLDLDRFKAINDTVAHATGDRLLRELADRLVARVGAGATIGRPGGDEFIVVIESAADEAAALGLARDLLVAVAEPLAYEATQLVMSASIGVAFFPKDGTTPEELMRAADTAMYAAKAAGGNAVEVYSAELHAKALADIELERRLRAALDREAIDVHYQPIVAANDGTVVALEALVRWEDDGRAIPPSEFVPLAEETGLIVRLGTYVLERACRFAATLASPGITLCVNISERQFREADFAGRVARALAASGLPAERLELEITEGAYISTDFGERNVRALADLGVKLSIDDFGTGYSALGYLKRLPVDTLKLDRSFVSGIVSDMADQAIVRAILAVAQHLKLAVVAEGVETAEQASFLRGLGCELLQGYFFSRPLPGPELERYLRKQS